MSVLSDCRRLVPAGTFGAFARCYVARRRMQRSNGRPVNFPVRELSFGFTELFDRKCDTELQEVAWSPCAGSLKKFGWRKLRRKSKFDGCYGGTSPLPIVNTERCDTDLRALRIKPGRSAPFPGPGPCRFVASESVATNR